MEAGRPTWRPRTWAVAAAILLVLAFVLSVMGVDPPGAARAATLSAIGIAFTVLCWALVRTRSQRRQYEEDLAAWATERATQAERLRIASDLHDLVSHGLGIITVRAAVARTMAGPAAETERASALADVERVSRETTIELRRMLTVLHEPGAASLHPADSLSDLPAIAQEADAAGLRVTLDLDDLGEVSPGVQLTICAVVREALNNTFRHAGPTPVRIRVGRDAESIVVDVRDAGPQGTWRSHPGAGHGLDGLRKRVEILGGTLRAKPEEHGFHLVARIPDTDHA
ncbi:sensor histidine kinase [Ornithinimicrobium pratense]|uniref:histidine kinase n=1 Tax=Ornithinimicrobium pratense TaxID=2593973 RepID=A0A5J6V880_9MICO|nr:histidine kinase [Ornithinimicrobium pratense]QFG69273.1 histidine kinase [Ornithinimicrobium pratense]